MSHDPNLPSITGESAVAARDQLRAQRTQVARAVAEQEEQLHRAKADLETRRKAMEAEFAAQRAALEAQLAPLRAEMAKMAETMWTVDLYLGRDEQLEQVRSGEPTPADVPITVRQRVLSADEESLVLVDKGGVDARSMDAFLVWIAADEANMVRVVPDERCVAAVVPSRQDRSYGDPYVSAMMAEANSISSAMTATETGLSDLGPVDPLPTGAELRRWWQDNHLGKAERLIVDVLADHPGVEVPVTRIATDTGYSASSGGFRNALSRLRSLQLATTTRPGTLRLSPQLEG